MYGDLAKEVTMHMLEISFYKLRRPVRSRLAAKILTAIEEIEILVPLREANQIALGDLSHNYFSLTA